MIILVTGGTGYLGGRICSSLVDSGYTVRIGVRNSRVALPPELNKCEVVTLDLLDKKSLEYACTRAHVIIHLAAMNAQDCTKDPEAALLVNGLGTQNLLTAASNKNVSSFIYFSTAHVYGSPLVGVIDEKTLPRPTHPYSITHRLAEDYVLEFHGKRNMNGVVLRLSNAIGPPLTKDANCWMLFLNDICRQAIVEKKITLNSHPGTERDFIPIDSILDVVNKLVLPNELIHYGSIYNLGSGYSVTIGALSELVAKRCADLYDINPSISLKNSDVNSNAHQLEYDSKKIRNQRLLQKEYSLQSVVDQTLDFCVRNFR